MGGCDGSKGKDRLIKCDMSGYDDLPSGEIEAPKTSMRSRVSEENARDGTRLKFMSGVKAGKTKTTKDTKVVVCGMVVENAIMRSGV